MCACDIDFEKCYELRKLKITEILCGYDVCGRNSEGYSHRHCSEKMRFLSSRIKSYINWPKKNIVDPYILSKNGFYYLGRSDYVRCAFCGIMVHNWQDGDSPETEHKRLSKFCPLMLGSTTDNVDYETNLTKIMEIIKEGIFIKYGNRDYVECKICRVKIMSKNRDKESIKKDHEHWSPYCPYILQFENTSLENKYFLHHSLEFSPNPNAKSFLSIFQNFKESLIYVGVKTRFRKDESYEIWINNFERWFTEFKNAFYFYPEEMKEKDWAIDQLLNVFNTIDVFKKLSMETNDDAEKYKDDLILISDHLKKKLY